MVIDWLANKMYKYKVKSTIINCSQIYAVTWPVSMGKQKDASSCNQVITDQALHTVCVKRFATSSMCAAVAEAACVSTPTTELSCPTHLRQFSRVFQLSSHPLFLLKVRVARWSDGDTLFFTTTHYALGSNCFWK